MKMREITIKIDVVIPCDTTFIDPATLQIAPKTTKVSKFIKKMARLCKKFGYQTVFIDDGSKTNENGGN